MEQITHYFEHMDYVSFGVIALPCIIIAVYGFLQVASGLAKGKNVKMQRNNSNKRCPQKYANGNLAAATVGGNATAAAATIAGSYQQQHQQQHNSNKFNAARKSRYNNNNSSNNSNSNSNSNSNNNHNKHGNAAYNMQKRSTVAGNAELSWRRLATSSCIEDKFLSKHNPGHRNSTSSEATSEDINFSDEQCHKLKLLADGGGGNSAAHSVGNKKSRSKRKPKTQVAKQLQQQQQQHQQHDLEQHQQQQHQHLSNPNGNVSGNKSKPFKCGNSANQKRNTTNSGINMGAGGGGNSANVKQTKCHGNNKTAGNGGGNKINSGNTAARILHPKSDKNTYSSSCSSSALSSPGSSPNSSCSSGMGSGSGSGSINAINLQSYGQNLNFLVPPLRQYERLIMDDAKLMQRLQRYIIDPHLLRVYGFPVESVTCEGAIEIFKCLPNTNMTAAHVMAVNETALTVINCHDGLNTGNFKYTGHNRGGGVIITNTSTSTNTNINTMTNSNTITHSSTLFNAHPAASTSTDSGNTSPRFLDSETSGDWSGSECESTANGAVELYCNYAEMERSLAKTCARCKQDFLVDEISGQYLTLDECSYHKGRYHRIYDENVWASRWTCCNDSDESAVGCARHDLHVWTGSVVGLNGPYRDFVQTRQRDTARRHEPPSVYALDCEMSYTGRGLDVTKVSLVALNGQLVYEHHVRPDADIVDYNTQYSGVTAKDLMSSGVKTLAEVQRDLLELIDADTILIGHGLDNDLRALRLVHYTLIDTSVTFPHSSGFPYRRALRHLTKTHLKRDIQTGDGTTGHSSFEDSRACMELMLWRVHSDLNKWED